MFLLIFFPTFAVFRSSLLVLAIAATCLAQGPSPYTYPTKRTGEFKRLREADTCPEPGFYQDVDDCQKFYRCAEHPVDDTYVVNKYEFRCPPGTVFDESISTCNHAYAVEGVKKECVAAVEATLEEIRNRPDVVADTPMEVVDPAKPFTTYSKNKYNQAATNAYVKPVLGRQTPQAQGQVYYQAQAVPQPAVVSVIPQYQQQLVYQSQPQPVQQVFGQAAPVASYQQLPYTYTQ